MGAEQLSTTPDDTRISALCPDDRALDAASRSTMAPVPWTSRMTPGSQHQPHPPATCAERQRYRAKAPSEPTSRPHQAHGRPPGPRPMRTHQKRIGRKHGPRPATKSDCGTDGSGSHVRQIADSALRKPGFGPERRSLILTGSAFFKQCPPAMLSVSRESGSPLLSRCQREGPIWVIRHSGMG